MDVLGRKVSSQVEALYLEILERWPARTINFQEDEDQETEGHHNGEIDGDSTIYLRHDADDEVIFHELLHDYFIKLGCPMLQALEYAGPTSVQVKDSVITTVSHPYVHEEMRRRGYTREAYWKRMQEGILAWPEREAQNGPSRLKNASRAAETILCSPLDTSSVQDHMTNAYPITWPLTEAIVEIIRPNEPWAARPWRLAIGGMLTLAQQEISRDGDPVPIKRMLRIESIFTETELRRTARRLVRAEVTHNPLVVALVDLRDNCTLGSWITNTADAAGRKAAQLNSRLFLGLGRFLKEIGLPFRRDIQIG
jgi:hypothetical protein